MSKALRVVITGAARGIGMATVQVLAKRGHWVVATDISAPSGLEAQIILGLRRSLDDQAFEDAMRGRAHQCGSPGFGAMPNPLGHFTMNVLRNASCESGAPSDLNFAVNCRTLPSAKPTLHVVPLR